MKPLSAQDLRAIAMRRRLSAFCVVAGVAAMATAAGAEIYRHMVPCALCLWERWPYKILIALGIVGATLPRSFGRSALGLAIVAACAGVGLGVLHVGVEHHLWQSPLPECHAFLPPPGQPLPETPAPPCDAPAYLWPSVPVSMALLSLIYQIIIAAVLIAAFPRTKRMPAHVPAASHPEHPAIGHDEPAGHPDAEAASGADDPG